MKILNHKFHKGRDEYQSDEWTATVEHAGKLYEIYIDRYKGSSYPYYTGGIKNTSSIKEYFQEEWIHFGFSNYKEQYWYILEAMIRVIGGDYSEIRGVGHCIATPM